MDIELLPKLTGQKRILWEQLLRSFGLEPDIQSDSTLLVWDNGTLIATGSRFGNILKCIAIDPSRQGEDLTATILTHLRQDALQAGHRHLFLYTKPHNRFLFSSLFFYPIAATESVLLMENQQHGIQTFLDNLPITKSQGVIGAAVMNCNPFTLGHRYLIEQAAKECDKLYVFVLSEDRSYFKTADRMAMVEAGTKDLTNVTILPTGPYLISSATFPTYFLKDKANLQATQCELDVAIFGEYFAPHFGITRRYVGSEPFCPVTGAYNQALHRLLPKYGIQLHEIPRLESNQTPVSATTVRKLIDEGNESAIRALVPESTYEYLKKNHFLKELLNHV